MTAEEIAEAFNVASERGKWDARSFKSGGSNQVHFDDHKSMVSFVYLVGEDHFLVKFRKTIGAFGDYANAIARGLTSILSALQAAGLPFVAPRSAEGIEIIVKHNGIGNQVSCRYLDPEIF